MHMPAKSVLFFTIIRLSSVPDIPAPMITTVALVKSLFPTGRRVLTGVDMVIVVKAATRRGFKLSEFWEDTAHDCFSASPSLRLYILFADRSNCRGPSFGCRLCVCSPCHSAYGNHLQSFNSITFYQRTVRIVT